MGFPAGWITDVVATRVDALHVIGNAVCPPQAVLALSVLVPRLLDEPRGEA